VLELVRALAIAWKNLAAYPSGHPALVASLGHAQQRLQDLLAASGAVTFGIASDGLVVAQEKLTSSHARDLARALSCARWLCCDSSPASSRPSSNRCCAR
jgi:hypothetical protein